jgi:hypothetical protein
MWHAELSCFLANFGLIRSKVDPGLHLFINDKNEVLLYVLVYVDDLLILAKNEFILNKFKKAISSTFDMTDLGPSSYCLGIAIDQSVLGVITLNQSQFIIDMLNRFLPNNYLSDNVKHKYKSPPQISNDEINSPLLEGENINLYRQIVGSFLYLVACTRPDIAVITNYLSRFMARPTSKLLAKAKEVLRYLKGTKYATLCYNEGKTLTGYADASYASDPSTRRSTSGYVFMLNGAAVSWSSKLQRTVATSTCHAEYVALFDATREAIYLRNLLLDMRITNLAPVTIFEDNEPAIAVAKNHYTGDRTKHIEIRFHFIRDALADNLIEVKYLETKEMLADALTKCLPSEVHNKLFYKIFGRFDNNLFKHKSNNS